MARVRGEGGENNTISREVRPSGVTPGTKGTLTPCEGMHVFSSSHSSYPDLYLQSLSPDLVVR